MAVAVVTDSTSYLPQDLRDEHSISVVSLSVNFGDESYRELDVDYGWFYRRLASEKSLPTSSAPPASEFVEAFSAAAERGDGVVGVFLSSLMSGTLQAAELARRMVLERIPEATIEIVDGRSNCMQLGMAALSAARSAESGADASDAARAARETIERTRFLFVPDTLEYLRRGGRIGGASALLGGILQIRPILTVADGETGVYSKVRTKRRALAEIASVVAADAERLGLAEVVVHHIEDEAEGRLLAEMLSEVVGSDIRLVPIGPVIGLHVGPGAAGAVYRTEQPIDTTSPPTA